LIRVFCLLVKECFGCKEQLIIDTVIMEQVRKNNRNIYTAFIDYKKAYDSVPHSWLIKILKIYKINLDLINFLSHVMTFWRTTLNLSINNTKLKSEPIQIKRGIYQGDSLSPLWFCLAINPLTNLLNSTGYGFNIRLNNTTLSKLNHLLYMDDIKLYASKKNHILSLLTITENFSNDIGMSFGIDKCKMQSICRGHYEHLEYITQEGEIIKNLNKGEFYKYLGINQSNHIQHSIIKENLEKQFYLRIKSILKSKLNGLNLIKAVNTYAHVRELVKKANKIIGAVWGIGERKFGHDFRRRIMMFDSLVKSVMMYGAEIWGWREQEGLEGVQGKYLKWVLGVDRETPGYIVMEETKRDGIRIEAGKRAIRFEERLIERGECRILQECLKEKRKEIGKGVWKEREAYFERNGYAGAEIERMREGGRAMTDELVQRDRDVQVQERRTRIRESRYNGKYEKIITEELPKYLGRESRKERVIIARFRCGNEERENKYWNEDRIRVCRMCGEKKETIEHMLNECVELREREESREEMLNEDGRGIEWMKKVEWRRGTICGEG
jgi:hypothetical protein